MARRGHPGALGSSKSAAEDEARTSDDFVKTRFKNPLS